MPRKDLKSKTEATAQSRSTEAEARVEAMGERRGQPAQNRECPRATCMTRTQPEQSEQSMPKHCRQRRLCQRPANAEEATKQDGSSGQGCDQKLSSEALSEYRTASPMQLRKLRS